MKYLLIALFAWVFIFVFAFEPHYEFIHSVTMLLTSLIIITYFKSRWWTLLLFVTFPTFFYRLSILLYTTFSLPIDSIEVTYFSLGLSFVSFLTILTAKYLPGWI